MKNIKRNLLEWIDENQGQFNDIADEMWQLPELAMQEFNSSRLLKDVLKKYGFSVTENVAGMPTAFVATYGEAGPVVGLSAEYDALDGLSQKMVDKQDPIVEGGPGQGCGHNILGTCAVMAAIALKETMDSQKTPFRIKLFGTPAEELCVGKPFMGRSGLFEGVDFFLDWHPLFFNKCGFEVSSAYFNVKYHFHGRSSHGNSPWLGRSALDGAFLTGSAIEMLREHIPPGPESAPNSINYTFPDVGGNSPGVVPEKATIWIIGRAASTEVLTDMMDRVEACAQAGALGSGTTVEKELITAVHERMPNKTLSKVMYDNFVEIGVPPYTEEEHDAVKEMQKSAGMGETGIDTEIQPFNGGFISVTDASEYSWNAPYASSWIAAGPGGGWWHNWIVTVCMGGSIAQKAMNTGAKVIAATAFDMITNPETIEKAQEEFRERMGEDTYKSLIPMDIDPPVDLNKDVMESYHKKLSSIEESIRKGDQNNEQ
ncbi:MAG: amidohydrolase [Anaerovoracaceae bacterium]|jgi:aminobenzoyl-glutamate utilization protein B